MGDNKERWRDTYEKRLRGVGRLPQGHVAVTVARAELVPLRGEAHAVYFGEDAGRPHVLHGLRVAPLPHADRTVLASGHICGRRIYERAAHVKRRIRNWKPDALQSFRLTEWKVRMRRQPSDTVDLVPLDLKAYGADLLLTLPHVATRNTPPARKGLAASQPRTGHGTGGRWRLS